VRVSVVDAIVRTDLEAVSAFSKDLNIQAYTLKFGDMLTYGDLGLKMIIDSLEFERQGRVLYLGSR